MMQQVVYLIFPVVFIITLSLVPGKGSKILLYQFDLSRYPGFPESPRGIPPH
jgi:hypothetical protein